MPPAKCPKCGSPVNYRATVEDLAIGDIELTCTSCGEEFTHDLTAEEPNENR